MRLSLENVSYRYPSGRDVLRNITFDLPSGASLAVLGPSGAGKSTLLRVIAGFLGRAGRDPLKGKATLDGFSSVALEDDARGRIGVVFQEPFLLPFLRVEQNLDLVGVLRNRPTPADQIQAMLDRIGLSSDGDKWPHQLSGGMRTRLALAREFLASPTLLLLDEPFGALDAVWRSSLYALLAEQRAERPSTVVLVTHDLTEAVLLCEAALILSATGEVIGKVAIGNEKPNYRDPAAVELFLASKAAEQTTMLRLLKSDHPASFESHHEVR
jgi:ABC-type nitrate/sulfonate/bicarbonate transport system ATPase subunit